MIVKEIEVEIVYN